MSIYREALGPAIDRMQPQIKTRFGFSSEWRRGDGTGVMDEPRHGRFYTLPFLYLGSVRRIMYPGAGTNAPFDPNYAYRDRFGRETVTWIRDAARRPRPVRCVHDQPRAAERSSITSVAPAPAVDIDLSVMTAAVCDCVGGTADLRGPPHLVPHVLLRGC